MKQLRNGWPAAVLTLVLLQAVSARAAVPAASSEWLTDSTLVEHWTLDNGLRVTTRHAPWAKMVAVSLAYDFGSDDDPPGRDGLGQTLSELAFTGGTDSLPERTRDELDSQRPSGWSFNATRRMTLLTEVATPAQFPGVISQVAGRMRGIKVTREGLRVAVQNARQVAEQQIFGPPSTSLFYITRDVALGRKEDAMQRHAAGRDLDKLTVGQAQTELTRRFVPVNASLAIAGNLTGFDMHRLVQKLFGALPAGSRFVRTSKDSLRAGGYIVQFPRPGLPSWAIGILAPALGDSLHPSFFLNSLVLSSYFDEVWRAEPNLEGAPRFFYPVLDEPEMVRIIPPPDTKNTTLDALAFILEGSIAGLYREVITQDDYDVLRKRAMWVVGGPMEETMLEQAHTQPAPWHSLARSMAVRELRGGDAFWADYRRRLERLQVGGLQLWADHYADKSKQVRLLLIPGR